MPWYAILLAPVALIFRLVTGVRNFLYDQGLLKSHKGEIPTLVVGNLSVGGTGKTPHVEFLISQFKEEKKIASLSRGYGRKTKGFLQLSLASLPEEVGDEPLQLFQKFKGEIPVFVNEDRVLGIQKIKSLIPQLDLVILDDAFQHRKLKADFYLLLTPYSKPFSRDFLMPMGRLRESRNGAKRADAVIVSKCPGSLSKEEKNQFRNELLPYLSSEVPVLFSSIKYGKPYSLGSEYDFTGKVILISGLADDRLFIDYSRKEYHVLESFSFPDHYSYSEDDLDIFLEAAQIHQSQNPVFLCTEKDAEKLKSLGNGGFLGDFPIFALPIEVYFEPQDREILLNHISKKLAAK
ncbi:lipid-A-disaccharide kinase [Algoriphagus boseongensis]|uniref:Tetraacyldisaccharide 4'-kinase n=1 Tax=Algoriphagus boseongensis TaxID=1442587 RepID=A0A4R6TCG3_9BACT|nr:tetraacyldisaccharide 4'-kinase [Algoriphagus boseongensis]TDQ19405.1 lipid-A-disaccharide kinase [Algoriphagus boseongensis]